MDFGGLCGTPFWNSSESWEAEKPYVSQCFTHLILVIGDCGVLWLVAPFELVKILRYRGVRRPWTALSVSKIVFKAVLLLICILQLIAETYAYVTGLKKGLDGLISAVIYFLTIILTVVLTMLCKERGFRVSLALPSFWMISTISNIVTIYNDINDLEKDDWVSMTSLVNDSLTFVISVVSLVLSCIAEKPAMPQGRQSLEYCPLEGAPLPSRLSFSWLLPILAKGVDFSLHQDFLIPLCFELKSATVATKFKEEYETRSSQNITSSSSHGENLIDQAAYETESQDGIEEFPEPVPNRKSLYKVLARISRKYLLIAALLELIFTALYFLPVYILGLIVNCSEEQEWHKYVYVSVLFVALLLSCLADSQRKYYGIIAGLRVKTAMMTAVFEKALRISQRPKDIKHHLLEDADNIFQMVCMMNEAWGAPLRLLIGVYMLWFFLGIAAFVGVATAILFIPIHILVEHCAQYYKEKGFISKRKRLDVFAECLREIKVLKCYAWENFFLGKLLQLRKTELQEIRKAEFLRIIFKFLILSSTSLVALTSFSAYVLTEKEMEAKNIFASFALMCLMKTPFRSFLQIFRYFSQGLASASRIQKLLETKEIMSITDAEIAPESYVNLYNASFSWPGKKEPCLKNVNLQIPASSLIAIVGKPGSGKSMLLRAILGELEKSSGEIFAKGEMAFIGDSRWIQNTTIEKNILFVKPKIEAYYRKVFEACRLNVDVKTLPAGEETEIGDKGVRLTEQQKLQVDLARAAYQNVEVYLLDEPLSGIDTAVAEHLYHRVIGRSGILKEKIRIFATTNVEFLPLVDRIVFLKDGCIVEQGAYSELTKKEGHFTEYLRTSQAGKTPSHREHHSMSLEDDQMQDKPERSTINFKEHNDPWCVAAGIDLTREVENVHSFIGEPMGLLKKVTLYVRSNGYLFTTLSILAGGLACCFEAGAGVWLSEWIEGEVHTRNLLVYACFNLAQVLFLILCGISVYAASTLSSGKLHTWIINRIMRAPQVTFDTTPSDKFLQSFDNDLQYMDERIPMTFYVWLISVFKVPALLVVVFVIAPFLCVFSIPLIFAFFVVQKLYLNTWRQLEKLTAATGCPLSNLLEDTLHSVSNIRAYRAAYHFINRFHLKLDTHNNCFLLFLLVSRWLSSCIDMIGAFFVLLTATTTLVLEQKDDGYIALAVVYAMQIAENLLVLVIMNSFLDVDLSAFERFQSLFKLKQEPEWEDPSNPLPPSWPDIGRVAMQNLSTSFGDDLYPALHGINIDIKPKEKVSLIGKEESGIETLLYSLFRLIELSEGCIIIDNFDISKVGVRDLRSRLAIVPQETIVIEGTLRENLDPFSTFTDDELWYALEVTNLKSHVASLDDVMDKYLCDKSKYLLSLARCVLKKSKVVIFEDPEDFSPTERHIFQGSTVITIGSRQLTDYDRIIRISSGEVVDERSLETNR